jgi:prepilin-type N-terminal cleavage/methylation domain-containing protein
LPRFSPPYRRRHDGSQAGFSLVELMVVLLIIAILLAVAIPTYLSARDRAENRAAQTLLSNAAQAEMVALSGTSGPASPGGNGAGHLSAYLGPNVKFVNTYPVSGPGQISYGFFSGAPGDPSGGLMKMASWSPAGVCWMALASVDSVYFDGASVGNQPGIFYGAFPTSPTSPCSQEPEVPTSGWRHSWASASAHL